MFLLRPHYISQILFHIFQILFLKRDKKGRFSSMSILLSRKPASNSGFRLATTNE